MGFQTKGAIRNKVLGKKIESNTFKEMSEDSRENG